MKKIFEYFGEHKNKNTIFFRLIKWLTLIFGFSGSVGFYFQAYEIWVNHSGGSVSFTTYAYWAIINVSFVLYMLTENNKVVLATSLTNLIGCLGVMLILILI